MSRRMVDSQLVFSIDFGLKKINQFQFETKFAKQKQNNKIVFIKFTKTK